MEKDSMKVNNLLSQLQKMLLQGEETKYTVKALNPIFEINSVIGIKQDYIY